MYLYIIYIYNENKRRTPYSSSGGMPSSSSVHWDVSGQGKWPCRRRYEVNSHICSVNIWLASDIRTPSLDAALCCFSLIVLWLISSLCRLPSTHTLDFARHFWGTFPVAAESNLSPFSLQLYSGLVLCTSSKNSNQQKRHQMSFKKNKYTNWKPASRAQL